MTRPETCSGSSGTCPADGFQANGSSCDNGDPGLILFVALLLGTSSWMIQWRLRFLT